MSTPGVTEKRRKPGVSLTGGCQPHWFLLYIQVIADASNELMFMALSHIQYEFISLFCGRKPGPYFTSKKHAMCWLISYPVEEFAFNILNMNLTARINPR